MEQSRQKKNRTICIAFPDKEFYQTCLNDTNICREFLVNTFEQFPELFPPDMKNGFKFHGFSTSSKQDGFRMRRIRLKNEHEAAYQIRPSFMMPYMIAETVKLVKYKLKFSDREDRHQIIPKVTTISPTQKQYFNMIGLKNPSNLELFLC